MDELDLHGIRHYKAEQIVENFVLLHDVPLRIITGNSPMMQVIVRTVAERYGLVCEVESYWNLGAFILKEKT